MIVENRHPVIGYQSFMVCGRGVNERVYCPAKIGRGGYTTAAGLTNGIYALPFVVPFDVKIVKLTKPIGTSGNYQMGIYSNSPDILYPDQRTWASGVFAAATTIDNLSVMLKGGECYWIAIAFDTSQNTTVVLNGSNITTGGTHVFGDDGTFATNHGQMLSVTGATTDIPLKAPSTLAVSTGQSIAFGIVFER